MIRGLLSEKDAMTMLPKDGFFIKLIKKISPASESKANYANGSFLAGMAYELSRREGNNEAGWMFIRKRAGLLETENTQGIPPMALSTMEPPVVKDKARLGISQSFLGRLRISGGSI